MHRLRVSLIELGIASVLTLSIMATPAAAAPIKDVLQACDNTKGCGYSIDKDGDISGCSKTGCFYCPNDGKRECYGVGQAAAPGGGAVPVRDDLLGKLLAAPAKNKALQPGLLGTGGAGFSTQGPAATGTVVAPPAAAPGPVLQ